MFQGRPPAVPPPHSSTSHDRPRGLRRLTRLLLGGGDLEEDGEERRAALPEPEQVPSPETLAATLSELIASASGKLAEVAALVGRSNADAQAYGRALAGRAEEMDGGEVSPAMLEALLGVTRAMIDRTQSAEARLRAMGDEISGLQDELADAREAAERDYLTGLPNRAAVTRQLEAAVATARALDRALSVAFCDIDHFKRLNDGFGHALGDRVLRLVGDALADGAGEGATVGRQGGEEFVMLFEGVSADEAAARVDAVREALAARVLRVRGTGEPMGAVTFSAGVASLRADEDGPALLDRADAALYRAKEAGRNRVENDEGRDARSPGQI